MKMRTTTVANLIDLLQSQDPDAQILFSCDYGDICHTKQALPIRGNVEEVTISESAYSVSGWALDEDDADIDEDAATYLVIR